MNSLALIGRLTKKPEVHYTTQGVPVAHFTLAVERSYRKENEASADFFNCSAFGKTAEIVEKHLLKGRLVGVCGHLHIDNYVNRNGDKVYAANVIVEKIDFLDSKKSFLPSEVVGNSSNEENGFDTIVTETEWEW